MGREGGKYAAGNNKIKDNRLKVGKRRRIINQKIHTIMKRILTLLIAAICTVGLWAEEFAIGELTFRTISDTEVELDDAKDDITSAYLGATITYQGKTYRVTRKGIG